MQHGEILPGDLDRLAFLQPAVGRDRPAGHAVFRALRRQRVEQEGIGAVRPLDRHAKGFGQFRRRARMVEMPMRQQDAPHGDAGLLDGVEDALGVAAGIDDDALLRLVVPHQGAVLLEGRHGDDGGGDAHGLTLARGPGGVQTAASGPARCAKDRARPAPPHRRAPVRGCAATGAPARPPPASHPAKSAGSLTIP